jgi:hypothetical protein
MNQATSTTGQSAAPSLPDPDATALTPGEIANLMAEDTDTLVGVSAMKARLLNQVVAYLAQIAAASTSTGGTSQFAVTLDSKTIDCLGTAYSTAVAATVKPQFDELHACLKAANEAIANLQRSLAEQNDKFTWQLRELREEILGLIEVECREPCGRLLAEISRCAERIEACEIQLPKTSRSQR